MDTNQVRGAGLLQDGIKTGADIGKPAWNSGQGNYQALFSL